MEITPIDIQQYQFKNGIMGYDKGDVDQFLEKVAEEMANLHRENQELKENLARTRQTLEEMRQTETTLKEALLTTQKVTDDLRENARKEAELLIEDGRQKGEAILAQAENRRIELIQQIQEINRQKLVFETSLESLIQRHQRLLAETTDWPQMPEIIMVEENREAPEFITGAEADALEKPSVELPGTAEELESLASELEKENSEASREFNRAWDV